MDDFVCDGRKMLIVSMEGAARVIPEEDYNRIIVAERKYEQLRRKVA